MKIEKSEIPMDPSYPFKLEKQFLKKADNRPDLFHWHSCFEITWILDGQGRYYVNEQIYDVTAGDIILFNNVEPHSWEVLSDTLELLVIIFQTEFITGSFAQMDYDYLKPFIERGSNFRNKLERSDSLTQDICTLMEAIESEYTQKTTGYLLMIKADVLKILTLLIRYSQDNTKSGALLHEKKLKMMRLSSVFEHIDNNYTEKITLEESARIAFMSPNYFSTYFKKVTGRNFSDYINGLRIARADKLMETSDLSILDIATQCGFHNMSNFYRIYRKVRGTTPTLHRGEQSRN